jgi:hypothetical protein
MQVKLNKALRMLGFIGVAAATWRITSAPISYWF